MEVETGPKDKNHCYFQETMGVANDSRRQQDHT